MPLPVLAVVGIGLLIGAVGSLSSAVLLNHKKAKQKLKAKPSGPPRAPSGMARSDLLKAARERLGMDAKNHFNFALCGGCGSGKSSLINAMRNREDINSAVGIAHDMFGSAPTGCWQTTMETRCYAFPANDELQHVRLWDMPGCGTHDHPSATYFQDKALFAFDVLLVVVEKELSEYEYSILEQAQQQNIPTVIVVTKADAQVESVIRIKFNTRNPPLDEYTEVVQEVLDEARQRVATSLSNRHLRITPTFVVSAWKHRDFMLHEENDIQTSCEESNGQSVPVADPHDEEEKQKKAALSLELSHLLDYIAGAAVRRRL